MVEIKGEYKVYVHINKINGKLYIGQTKQTLLQRSRADGSGYKHSRHFLITKNIEIRWCDDYLETLDYAQRIRPRYYTDKVENNM